MLLTYFGLGWRDKRTFAIPHTNETMQHIISRADDSPLCKITLSGKVDVGPAKEMLTSVWLDTNYRYSRFVIWNLEACESFPDFNEFVHIVNHARKNKPRQGPSRIAFCSSTFENSMLVKVLQGFTTALPKPARFFANEALALEWFAKDESDAA